MLSESVTVSRSGACVDAYGVYDLVAETQVLSSSRLTLLAYTVKQFKSGNSGTILTGMETGTINHDCLVADILQTSR